jgi:ParB family transcriptional regulator, chromosome partitioning protein
MPTPRLVPVVHLIPPPEPLRVAMDDNAMADLERSIKELGIIQPLAVMPKYFDKKGDLVDKPTADKHKGPEDADMYEIIDGHRRQVAAERLHLVTVPCMVFENAAEAKYAIMLHANVCREDVTPYEEGVQFLELATKYSWSMDDLMRFFHQSEDYINDRVDVARKDQAVAEAVRDRKIGLGHAKEILKCAEPGNRTMLLEQAAVHGATVAGLRQMRHTFAREQQELQGLIPANTGAQFVPGAVLPHDVCIWCGKDETPEALVTLKVHQYELSDLKAVLEKFSLKALLAQLGASDGRSE